MPQPEDGVTSLCCMYDLGIWGCRVQRSEGNRARVCVTCTTVHHIGVSQDEKSEKRGNLWQHVVFIA